MRNKGSGGDEVQSKQQLASKLLSFTLLMTSCLSAFSPSILLYPPSSYSLHLNPLLPFTSPFFLPSLTLLIVPPSPSPFPPHPFVLTSVFPLSYGDLINTQPGLLLGLLLLSVSLLLSCYHCCCCCCCYCCCCSCCCNED